MYGRCKKGSTGLKIKKFRFTEILRYLTLASLLLLLIPTAYSESSGNIAQAGIFQGEPLIMIGQDKEMTGPYADMIGAIAEKGRWKTDQIHGPGEAKLEGLENRDIKILASVPDPQEIDERYILTSESITTARGVACTDPQYVNYFPQNGQSASLNTWESPAWLKLSVGIGGGMLLIFIILSFILKDRIETKTSELNSKNRELETEVMERLAVEKKLKQYFTQLKHSNELKDLFTDILRHDLINPATVIKGYVEYLLENEDDEQKITALKAIERNNLKLIEMIENAANLAKLESVEELDFEEMDIGTILEEVIQNLKPEADEKQMKIEYDNKGNYPAKANRIIEEVFSNLISNSIKYSAEATTINVKVTEKDNGGWKVSITDEGEGIPDHDKPLIFDRFERAGKVNIKGTGLGLAIVKRIVELHEGNVGVEDNPSGKGSVFWVTLDR
ncbi:MAG: HAMP domain-containing histidine kinase [Methanosarcinaceae archaeon]|nr:HAMP domain-containing histidine kinase [Methanosarcinaceae archaeon]